MTNVASQYPFIQLPEIGLLSEDEFPVEVNCLHARKLTEEEKTLLQSLFAWMQAGDDKVPRSTRASYSELWFMVRNVGHMRAVSKMAIDARLDYVIAPHKERYEATGQRHSFYEVLNYDFSPIEEVLFNCAEFEADLSKLRKNCCFVSPYTLFKHNSPLHPRQTSHSLPNEQSTRVVHGRRAHLDPTVLR